MSAYIIVEATVRNPEALKLYSSQATPILKQFGGETLASGPWELVYGDTDYERALIVRFPDRNAALAWYNSPEYQALLDVRSVALDCRFRLIS